MEEISKKFDLEIRPEVYHKLRLDLQKIDKVIDNINEKWKRKRLINITYLIKRVLSEYDKSEADKIQPRRGQTTPPSDHLCVTKKNSRWRLSGVQRLLG